MFYFIVFLFARWKYKVPMYFPEEKRSEDLRKLIKLIRNLGFVVLRITMEIFVILVS